MEGFLTMLGAQLVLMTYVLAGLYSAKRGLVDDRGRKMLVDLILQVLLPCMIFESFSSRLTAEVIRATALAFVTSVVIAAAAVILSNILFRRYPPEKAKILKYSLMVNNAGFLGLTLVKAVFGDEGLLTASIFVIPNRVLMWTAGLSLFEDCDFKTSCRNILLNPNMIAVYLGLTRQICGIPMPDFLDTALKGIGSAASPLSMMVIGMMVYGVNLKSLVEPVTFYFSAFRLILLPVGALAICRLLGFDPVLTGVCLVMTGMPAGSTSALMAAKYGGDQEFASKLVIATTLLSLVTAPLLMFLL